MAISFAIVDSYVASNIPLGFLYLLPMLLVGGVLNRGQVAAAALVCTFFTEAFNEFRWSPIESISRDILYFSAFFGIGIFVHDVVRRREAAAMHLEEVENEILARREAEEQLKVFVESSPAAIFTSDANGIVLMANNAAHKLFGVAAGSLPGISIGRFLPLLENVPSTDEHNPAFRTVMQCRGHKWDGDVFLADVWFSTYRTSAGPRLAAMVLDTSEDLRTREEFSLQQMLAGSRILMGAVSHEVRNVCGAIAVVHQNLARNAALDQSLTGNKDFEALGSLILTLERIAALNLRQMANQASSIDLHSLLEELRIIVESALKENGIEVEWSIQKHLPEVWADRHSLMQVFLNLIKNSERAMEDQPVRRLMITVKQQNLKVTVRVQDTGCGVASPDRLFRPFQPDAQASGLGLYLSRAFMRSFRGDLRFEPEPAGASFLVDLAAVDNMPEAIHTERSQYVPADPNPVGR